ncbi:hypothetical protein MCEMSHM24_02702 [Comamonadaceae bacterium]
MGFKRTQSPTFGTEVVVNVPNDKGGFDRNTFFAKFKRPSGKERESLAKLTHEELLRKQLAGWDMKDEDTGEDVPFSAENLEAALEVLPTPLAAAMAFWETVNGARTKN